MILPRRAQGFHFKRIMALELSTLSSYVVNASAFPELISRLCSKCQEKKEQLLIMEGSEPLQKQISVPIGTKVNESGSATDKTEGPWF